MLGDKMVLIDKDRDGVITTEEVALACSLLKDRYAHTHTHWPSAQPRNAARTTTRTTRSAARHAHR
jgi:hypothetical protein